MYVLIIAILLCMFVYNSIYTYILYTQLGFPDIKAELVTILYQTVPGYVSINKCCLLVIIQFCCMSR